MSKSVWQVQHHLVQDFTDLFLPPDYPLSVEKDYPKTASMEDLVKDRFDSLKLPDTKILRLDELFEESNLGEFSRKVGDWGTIFGYDVLEGFGHQATANLDGAAFNGLRELAATFGIFLGRELQRVFTRHRVFADLGSFMVSTTISLFSQIPAKELGDAIRQSITPAYLRAGETVRYEIALLDSDQTRLRESLTVLEASDAELEREIAHVFSGYSSEGLGRTMQQIIVEGLLRLAELFSTEEFAEKLVTELPGSFRLLSWYVGRRLQYNLRYDPQRTFRLLRAIDQHKEIGATFEMYRYRYGWQGDRNNAIVLGWRAVGRKYFRLSGRVEDIEVDEEQEKLIGVAQGLEDYTNRNQAIKALGDGLSGGLGTYLKTAAQNQAIGGARKRKTLGNKVLTEAKHASNLRSVDDEEELSDEEILSRQRQKYHPMGDSVAQQFENRERNEVWYNTLTEEEKRVVDLKLSSSSKKDTQKEIALQMGISQQRVSQLLRQARKKWQKLIADAPL